MAVPTSAFGGTDPHPRNIHLGHFGGSMGHQGTAERCEIPANYAFVGAFSEYTSAISSTTREELRTRHGHPLNEAASALQKAIRRSQADDAAYWSLELAEGGFAAYAWRRLLVIVSEDVGVAAPGLPADVYALYSIWQESKKAKRPNTLALLHATFLLARAKKSRMICHALIAHSADAEYREPPDHALDRHTRRGRQLGRDYEHFFDEAAQLADPQTGELTPEGSIPDPYLERARSALEADR